MPSVAVFGCGRWGQNLVRCFHELGALAAVVDPSAAARARGAALAPSAALHGEAGAVLRDPSIDAVAIAAPATLHAALCEAALAAGKHVLCEKPFTLRLDDAERLQELAARRERIVAVGHLLEHHPAVARLRELVATGALGELRALHCRREGPGQVRRDESVLWSFAPHDVAVALRLFGALPARVSATGTALLRPGTTDLAAVHLSFAGGGAAHLFVSWLSPVRERRLTAVGTRGAALLDEVAGTLSLHDTRVELRAGEPILRGGGPGRPLELAKDEPLRLACADFLAAIDDRRAPLADVQSAVDVIRVLDAAQRSLDAGGAPVELTPPSRPARLALESA